MSEWWRLNSFPGAVDCEAFVSAKDKDAHRSNVENDQELEATCMSIAKDMKWTNKMWEMHEMKCYSSQRE